MSSHARPSRHAHGKWEGFDALHAALQGLASAKGTSQNRIGAVAKLALQYAKFYKHVVHDVEVFLWKAEPEHRLAGGMARQLAVVVYMMRGLTSV